jgi:hypothetical protein
MAITVKWYGQGMLNLAKGNIDMDTDTFKLTLHTSTYTPNLDTDDFYNDATNELSTANGYTNGGVTLSGVGVTYDAASDQVRIDWTDPTWTFTGSVTWRYGVIRKARGGASTADELVALLDWGADNTVNTAYTLQLDSAGLLYIDVT